jgi:hypothetical protein
MEGRRTTIHHNKPGKCYEFPLEEYSIGNLNPAIKASKNSADPLVAN